MVKILNRFFKFLLKYKGWLLAFFIVKMVAVIATNLFPYILKLLVDAAGVGNNELLLKIVFGYVALRLVGGWLTDLTYYLADKVLIPTARDIRLTVFSYIQDLDFAFHTEKNTGALISAFKRGNGAFWSIFDNLFHELLDVFIGLLITLYFFWGVDRQILLIMLVLFAFNIVLSWLLVKLNLKKRQRFNEADDRVSGVITDNLLNYETVKFFAQEERERKRLETEHEDWVKKLWGFSNSFRIMGLTINLTSSIGMYLMLRLVVLKLIKGEIGTGDFIMVTGFVTTFYYRFFQIFHQLRNLAKNFIDIEKYFEILDNVIAVKDPKWPTEIKKVNGKIEFRKVNFSYPRRKQKVLSDINLVIEPGESVAFVGRSGAGKTTIVKMLLRFYNLKSGQILLDGVGITRMKKSYLRSLIGVVPQEPVLFNNTVKFNVGYGKRGAKMTEIREAARKANLDEFIDSLPEKYETVVGERGIKLSGGQKQRLAIARAFLADPQVIVFDEATSNLDSESEEKIQEALWAVAKNRTVLIIAHRFATIRRADRIVVLDGGRIVETGTHRALIGRKDGVYNKLWTLQAKGKLEKDVGGLLDKR